MIIKSIKASRIPNRAIIYFENDTFLPVSTDDVYNLHLAKGLDIDLVDNSFKYLLYNYALFQLSLSPKLPKDLVRKMKIKSLYYAKKYNVNSSNLTEIIDQIVIGLQNKGLLSERDFVESTIHRLARKPNRYIQQLLQSKGVNVGQYQDLFAADDSSLLKKILATKKYQNLKTADFKTKRKLIASLLRKGFAYDDIKSAIDYSPSD